MLIIIMLLLLLMMRRMNIFSTEFDKLCCGCGTGIQRSVLRDECKIWPQHRQSHHVHDQVSYTSTHMQKNRKYTAKTAKEPYWPQSKRKTSANPPQDNRSLAPTKYGMEPQRTVYGLDVHRLYLKCCTLYINELFQLCYSTPTLAAASS